MVRAIGYLSPMPPVRSGIADYAAAYKAAVERAGEWTLQLMNPDRLRGDSPQDVLAARRRVLRWKRTGQLEGLRLVHAEIGVKEHDEFWTLFWLRRFAPELPYCITVHDPRYILTPAIYPLAFGTRSAGIRRGLRLLDHAGATRVLVRPVLRGAATLITLTRVGGNVLAERCGRPVAILPFVSYGYVPVRRRPLSPERSIIILFLGFWGRPKGVDVLLAAVERVACRTTRPFRLVLAGGAEEGNHNRAYVNEILRAVERSPARERIDVRGFAPPEDLERTFAEADVFVAPSRVTMALSRSSVVARAMASGLPVVGTSIPGMDEDLVHMRTGLTVPPDDVEALAEALVRVISDDALRLALSEGAVARMVGDHGDAAVARAAARLYQEVARW